jgi:hypothetical protein
MIKKLVVFGDSWTFGDELICPELKDQVDIADSANDEYRLTHCWGGIVADHFDLEFYNFGFNGMSLQSTVWTMLWWLENHDISDSLVIVGLTQPYRTSWFLANNKFRNPEWNMHIHSVWEQTDPVWQTMQKNHLTHSGCKKLYVNNRQQSIIFFDGVSDRYKIPLGQFDCYPNTIDFYSKNHIGLGESAQDWAQSYITQTAHPDEQGHILISNRLISWINSVKLIE